MTSAALQHAARRDARSTAAPGPSFGPVSAVPIPLHVVLAAVKDAARSRGQVDLGRGLDTGPGTEARRAAAADAALRTAQAALPRGVAIVAARVVEESMAALDLQARGAGAVERGQRASRPQRDDDAAPASERKTERLRST